MSPSSAGLPTMMQPPDLSALAQVMLALLVVIALMWGTLVVMRRVGASRFSGGGLLRIVAALPLGTRERVVLIQVEDAKVLVGVTPGGLETLYVHRPGASATAVPEALRDFARQLDGAVKDTQAP